MTYRKEHGQACQAMPHQAPGLPEAPSPEKQDARPFAGPRASTDSPRDNYSVVCAGAWNFTI
jgi:hypothetical protein